MDKENLKNYLALMKEAKYIKSRIEQLEDDAKNLKVFVADGMPRSSSIRDSIGEIIANIEGLKTEYLHIYKEALRELCKIEKVIDSLTNETERLLMRKRYIEGKHWADICTELNYSWKQIHRIHSRILKKIAKDDTQ